MNNKPMLNNQRGVSLGALLIILVILVLIVIMGLKVLPAYMEYFKIKGGVEAIAQEKRSATPNDIRKAFDARATIDDINSIKGSDLEITKDGNEVVVSAAYRKEIPLFANVGVHIDFTATSKP
jgi:hypothetical protein